MTDPTFNTDGSKGPDVSAHVTDTEAHGYFTSTLADPAQARRVAEHLESCGPCRDRALEMQRKSVSQMRSSGPAGPGCFSADVLTEVAAGVFRNDTQQILDHASSCWSCAELLCADLEAFSGFQPPESAELLARLKTSSAGWPEKFARESASAAKRDGDSASRRSWSVKPLWALAGVAAAAAIALVFFFPRQTDLQRAESQLAKSYGQQRTIAMRIPQFPHAELKERQVLRAGGAVGDYPPAFREVQRLLAEQKLQANPSTPEWEHVRARMELLEGTDESVYRALRWLERTAQASPERADLQLDLAVAYYERESRAETPNMMRVIDILAALLSRKDLAREDQAAALFNLALAFEKSEAWDLAVAKWEEYLRLDPDSAWSTEARSHLDAARKHLPQSRAPSPPNTEDRLDAALRKLLPQKLQSHPETAESVKATAELDRLAADMVKNHRDPWLRDFLTALRRDVTPAALDLSAAVDANAKGQYAKVLEYAGRAERAFATRGNTAGLLRAQFEQVYAYHRLLKGKECLLRANALKTKTDATDYGWIKAQLANERAICLDYVGDLAESDASFAAGRREAEATGYQVLVLRNLGLTASTDRLHGNCDRAWQYNVLGLRRYWQGRFPEVRLFEFYYGLRSCAVQQRQWHAAEGFFRQAVAIIGNGENRAQIGIAHIELASLLSVLNRDAAAEAELRIGAAYLANAPPDPTVRNYQFASLATLAGLQLKRGQPAAALQALGKVDGSLLHTTQTGFIPLNYYRVLGDVQLHMGRLPEAEVAFRRALDVSEQALAEAAKDPDRLRWLNETDGAYRGLTRVLLTQGLHQKAFEVWEWYRSRLVFRGTGSGIQSAVRRAATRTTSVREPPGPLRLVYVSFADGTQLWVKDENGLRSVWLPKPSRELSETVARLLVLCSTPDTGVDQIRQESRTLYQALLAPVEERLSREEEVVIETDGPLAGLPFEIVFAESGSGLRPAITYSPGMMFDAQHRWADRLNNDVLILDASSTLPGRRREIENVQKRFARTVVLRTPELTRSSALSGMDRASVIHFVGHSQTVGTGAALVLSPRSSESFTSGAPDPEGLIVAGDVEPARLRKLRMVVLAACSTGESDGRGLMDPESLISAFTRAGVPTVIASRWNVDSVATSRLMEAFYRRLGEEASPAVAMQGAREEVIAEMPHPFHWAAFTVTGVQANQKSESKR